MGKVNTAESSRNTLGVGSIINPQHCGISKKPTETRSHTDEVTAEDIKPPKSAEEIRAQVEGSMPNPNFR